MKASVLVNNHILHILDSCITVSNKILLLLSYGPNFIPNIRNDPLDYISCLSKNVLNSLHNFNRSVIIKKHRHLNIETTISSYSTLTINDKLHVPCPSYYPPHNSPHFKLTKL